MAIINIGVDIVEIFRIKDIIRNNPRFVERIFTETEIQSSRRKKGVYGEYAIRFAAKEATMKALGTGWRKGIRWQDIEIVNKNSGQPYIILQNKAKKLAAKLGVKRVLVSLSHSQKYAVANVILSGTVNKATKSHEEIKPQNHTKKLSHKITRNYTKLSINDFKRFFEYLII